MSPTNSQIPQLRKKFFIFKSDSESQTKLIKSVSIRNQNTAKQYHSRLLFFERFAQEQYKISVDDLGQKLKNGKDCDPYDILNDFCLFLQNNYNIGSVTFRDKIILNNINS